MPRPRAPPRSITAYITAAHITATRATAAHITAAHVPAAHVPAARVPAAHIPAAHATAAHVATACAAFRLRLTGLLLRVTAEDVGGETRLRRAAGRGLRGVCGRAQDGLVLGNGHKFKLPLWLPETQAKTRHLL